MVMGYEIAGYTAVATRMRFFLPTYLLMKDSPEKARDIKHYYT